MPESPRSYQLLKKVAARLYLAWLGDRVYRAFLVLCAVYALGLIVSRACGFVTGWFAPISLVVIPVGAVLVGLLLARRPRTLDAARQVDRASGEKDLFLTLALLNDSEGEYKPLVARSAEAKAGSVKPRAVVPFDWERRTVRSAFAFVALAAAVIWLPQFDPFGKVLGQAPINFIAPETNPAVQSVLVKAVIPMRNICLRPCLWRC